MKILKIVLIAVGAFIMMAIAFVVVGDWWGHLPEPSFRRHFGTPIPQSVVIVEKWGRTALAGSSEFMVFSIATNDLAQIIANRGMKAIALDGANAGYAGTNLMVHADLLTNDIATAVAHAVTPSRAFADSSFEGMIFNLMLVDSNGTTVFYHYFKM